MSEELLRKMLEIWWEAPQRASIYVLMRQAKMFSRAMCNVALDLILQKFGMELESADNPAKALDNYSRIEKEIGLSSEGDVGFKEDSGVTEVEIKNCIYGEPCMSFLTDLKKTGEFNEKTYPCVRMGIYSAAIENLTNSKITYSMVQFAPGLRCTGEIEVM